MKQPKPILSLVIPALLLQSCGDSKDVVKPAVKPLMEAVYASGFVVSEDEYQVFSQADGYLGSKLVSDGQSVKRGDPLFIIEAGQQSARSRLAKENYEMAEKNYREDSPIVRELRTAMESAQTKMRFDSVNFERYTNLLKGKATSQSEYDRIKVTYENSANDYRLQKSRYEKTRNQLYLDLQNARTQLQIATDESGRYTLRSDVDGMVFKTMKEKGELVRRNEAIAIIGRADKFYVQLNVDELDIQRIQSGQEVLVKIDAYPDKVYHAQVDKIYPMVNQQQQSFRVDASFTEKLPGNFSGLALEANIVIRQKDKALVVPKTALLPGDSVLIKTDDGDKKVKVVPGIETIDEVEIVEGLDSTGRLIVNK
jgi:multidrug resistance efflux pump